MINVRGHEVRIVRKHMCREPGWWFTVTVGRAIVAEGWTVGYGPKAKSQAMKDALEAIAARETLLELATSKGWS